MLRTAIRDKPDEKLRKIKDSFELMVYPCGMRPRSILSLPVVVLLTFHIFVNAQSITTDQVRVTTTEAPWVVYIDNFNSIDDVQIKPDGKSGYFLLSPHDSGLNVSLFIEPVVKCQTSEACRDFVLQTGNPAWGKFQDLGKGTIDKFSYFEFYRPVVMNAPLKMFDMYAQFVSDGYWIDLHISKQDYKKEDHALFEKLVRSVRFVSKKSTVTESEKAYPAIQSTANSWLELWGAGKCRESFSALTSLSRELVTVNDWVPYCARINKELGKVTSRNLIAVTLIKSMPQAPDRSGATFSYESTYEAGWIVEFVTLTTEKDGRWTVSNYVTRGEVQPLPAKKVATLRDL